MKAPERAAAEARLPPRYRGHAGYRRLLGDVRLRISVSGVRGKSGLVRNTDQALRARGWSVYAKETGTDPISYKDGVGHAILRDPAKKALLEETVWEVKKYWPMDALVLENQAITPYTTRIFNQVFCRAQYVLITNVRLDHQGTLGRDRERIARALAQSAPRKSVIVSGERDPRLKRVMEREARENETRFVDAAPREAALPGVECVAVLDAVLQQALGRGLTGEEWIRNHRDLRRRFQWSPSRLPDIVWFHGAEINDVDSTRLVVDHLLRIRRTPINFVAYFRSDRPDRTASFVPFLREAFEQGIAASAYVAGHAARSVARRLFPWPVRVVPDRVDAAAPLLERIAQECRGQAVMTIANAVPPWPRAVAAGLGRNGDAPARTPTASARLALPHAFESFAFARRLQAHRLGPSRPTTPPAPLSPVPAAAITLAPSWSGGETKATSS